MLNDQTTDETRLKLIELLRDERNRHIDTILRTNGYLTIGAGTIVLSSALASHELRGLRVHLGVGALACAAALLARAWSRLRWFGTGISGVSNQKGART